MLRRKLNDWFSSISIPKLLLLTAILIAIQTIFSVAFIQWQLSKSERSNLQTVQTQINQLSNEQISYHLHKAETDLLETKLEQLIKSSNIVSVALYEPSGNLLLSKVAPEFDLKSSTSRVSQLNYLDQELGYLILKFKAEYQQQPVTKMLNWLYLIGTAVWLLLPLVIIWLRSINTPKESIEAVKTNPATNDRQELQQFLKRNQQKKEGFASNHWLVVSADWSSLTSRIGITNLLYRWTAHNDAVILEFEKDILKIGLSKPSDQAQWQQIQVLDLCLKDLNLKPKLLLHKLKLTDPIYQNIFSVISEAIWFEQTVAHTSDDDSFVDAQTISIEIEAMGEIALIKASSVHAQSHSIIERQSRFYLS